MQIEMMSADRVGVGGKLKMKHQATRLTAVMLSVLLVAAVPAQANTITFTDVIVRAMIDGDGRHHSVDLYLRSLSQQHENQIKTPSQRETTAANSGNQPGPQDSAAAGAGASVTGTVLGAAQDGNVEVVEVGDITGTICDCGEIPLIPIGGAGGGFPFLFPLLGLAAIPLLFLGGDRDTVENIFPPTPTPTIVPPPPPPPTPIPEPTTMLLLGSGLLALGAGSRRRRRRALAVQVADQAEVREV